ncbi:MAG: ATP-binding protein [Bacteroidetes bacterium]|nr:ATP-binding protein [Bacteroidota bacterium]
MHPIRKLIQEGEHESLDFKQEISSARKIAKTMVSFANHKGGKLLVGVRDNGAIAGVRSEDEKYMLETAASFYCRPEIQLSIEEWELDGKTVLEVNVPEGKDKPYAAMGEDNKWWVYIRVKDKSLLASKIVVDVLRAGKKENLIQFGHNEKKLLDYLANNDRITLAVFCKIVNISRRRASRIIVSLIRAGVIRSHNTEKTEYYTLS